MIRIEEVLQREVNVEQLTELEGFNKPMCDAIRTLFNNITPIALTSDKESTMTKIVFLAWQKLSNEKRTILNSTLGLAGTIQISLFVVELCWKIRYVGELILKHFELKRI